MADNQEWSGKLTVIDGDGCQVEIVSCERTYEHWWTWDVRLSCKRRADYKVTVYLHPRTQTVYEKPRDDVLVDVAIKTAQHRKAELQKMIDDFIRSAVAATLSAPPEGAA